MLVFVSRVEDSVDSVCELVSRPVDRKHRLNQK